MDQPEHRLSFFVDSLLDRILVGDCWYTAIDHSGAAIGKSDQAQMAWRQRQKAMGIKPAHLDWCVYQRETGLYAQFELKSRYNQPTDGQETTMRLLRERGIPTGCAWNLQQFYTLLVEAGFRLHANAANILVEIEARHAAAQDGAALKSAPKKRSYKATQAKPTQGQLRKVEAMRARGIRF